jgi:CRP-like cAMP-binding protein
MLLDLDPDLGRGIERREWESARQATRASLAHVDPGEWTLAPVAADGRSIIGLIVDDGMISRETALGDHVVFELLTPGDVLVLPVGAPDDLVACGAFGVAALSNVRVIVLDSLFIRAAVRWPVLLSNLHRRLEAQRERLAVQALAAHFPRAEDRVLMTLWLLADRCGRVTTAGTVVPLFLSHEVLGRLAAARRPTVTLALGALETADFVRRCSNGHFALSPSAHLRVRQLATGGNGASQIGPRLRLDQRP